MTDTARRILDEALNLSDSDRRMVAEALMGRVAQAGAAIDPMWRDEVLQPEIAAVGINLYRFRYTSRLLNRPTFSTGCFASHSARIGSADSNAEERV